MTWFNNIKSKSVTVAGQAIGDTYVAAFHDPVNFNYSGIYTVELKSGANSYQFDLDITGSTSPTYNIVSPKLVNIVESGSGITNSLTDFNANFELHIIDNGAGNNFITLKFLSVFMGGNFALKITNKMSNGLLNTNLIDYLGKKYSTLPGYPYANDSNLSPVAFIGGGGGGSSLTKPVVITSAATSITDTAMTLNGNLTLMGSETGVGVYFYYRVQGSGSAYTATPIVNKTSTGAFSASISGLSGTTTYEYFAVAAGQTNIGNDGFSTPNGTQATTASVTLDADSMFNITGSVTNATATALNSTSIPSVTNGAITSNTVVASANSCVSQTVEVAQQPADVDWVAIKPIYQLKPNKFTVDSSSTNTTPVFTHPNSGVLVNGDKVWVDDGGMKEISVGSVVETTVSVSANPQMSVLSSTPNVSGCKVVAVDKNYALVTIGTTYFSYDGGYTWFPQTNSGLSGTGIAELNYCNGVWYCYTLGTFSYFRSTDGLTWSSVVQGYSSPGSMNFIGGKFYMRETRQLKIYDSSFTLLNTILAASIPGDGGSGAWGFTNNVIEYNGNLYTVFQTSVSNCTWIKSSDGGLTWSATGQAFASAGGNFSVDTVTNRLVSVIDEGAGAQSLSYDGTTLTRGALLGTGYYIGAGVWYKNNYYTSKNTNTGAKLYGTGANISVFTIPGGSKFSSNGDTILIVDSIPKLDILSGLVSSTTYKYTCSSITAGRIGTVPLTAAPTAAYKAGQLFQSDLYTTTGSPSFTNDTISAVTRSGDTLTITCDQRAEAGANRYAAEKVTVNKDDAVVQYQCLLYV